MRRSLLAAGLVLTLLAAGVEAAVVATPVFIQKPRITAIAQPASTAQTTVIAGSATGPGTKVSSLQITNTTAGALTATCQLKQSAVVVTFLVISVPLNAGTANGVPVVNGFSAANVPGLPIDSDGNPYVYLTDSNDSITCASSSTTAGALNYIAVGADF